VKLVISEAFVEGKLEAPKQLARTVHHLYFGPKYEDFRSRTIWSLSNAFTSALKELGLIPQFKATAKVGEFLEAQNGQSAPRTSSSARALRIFRLPAKRVRIFPKLTNNASCELRTKRVCGPVSKGRQWPSALASKRTRSLPSSGSIQICVQFGEDVTRTRCLCRDSGCFRGKCLTIHGVNRPY
jgi:hypothetical protein